MKRRLIYSVVGRYILFSALVILGAYRVVLVYNLKAVPLFLLILLTIVIVSAFTWITVRKIIEINRNDS